MNEIKACNERIATYRNKIESLKETQKNLKIWAESGTMKQIEVDARTKYVTESIEMFEEKIIKNEEIIAYFDRYRVGQKVMVAYGTYKGLTGTIVEVSRQGVTFVDEKGTENGDVHPDALVIEYEIITFFSSEASKGTKRKVYFDQENGRLLVSDNRMVPVKPYKHGFIRADGTQRYHMY